MIQNNASQWIWFCEFTDQCQLFTSGTANQGCTHPSPQHSPKSIDDVNLCMLLEVHQSLNPTSPKPYRCSSCLLLEIAPNEHSSTIRNKHFSFLFFFFSRWEVISSYFASYRVGYREKEVQLTNLNMEGNQDYMQGKVTKK